jgi:hypothetical protein
MRSTARIIVQLFLDKLISLLILNLLFFIGLYQINEAALSVVARLTMFVALLLSIALSRFKIPGIEVPRHTIGLCAMLAIVAGLSSYYFGYRDKAIAYVIQGSIFPLVFIVMGSYICWAENVEIQDERNQR